MIDPNQIKAFWEKRGEKYHNVPFESVTNLEEDQCLLAEKLRLEAETVLPLLPLRSTKNLLDLGAGCGTWSFRFAPQVNNIVAVEYASSLAEIGRIEAMKRGTTNIEFVVSAAEDFVSTIEFDIIFISGLFVYLTDTQASKLVKNLKDLLSTEGMIFLRDGTSILNTRHQLTNIYSETLKTKYSAIYRTHDEFDHLFAEAGFVLNIHGQMFEEGSLLNKYPETRLRYYSFTHAK